LVGFLWAEEKCRPVKNIDTMPTVRGNSPTGPTQGQNVKPSYN
jgi:hypothetical protein